MLTFGASVLFVLIWSTGFIVARAVVPHAAPELVLTVRLLLTAALMAGVAAILRETWPKGRMRQHLVAGSMLHGVYLGMSWWAVALGMPAGVMSLLGAIQPVIVMAASALFLNERQRPQAWAGLGIAIVGVICVLTPALGRVGAGGVAPLPILLGVLAVLGMTGGTLVQRGAIRNDGIAVSGAVQNLGGAMVTLVAMMALQDFRWEGSPMLWLGLGWSVLGLSGAGLSLLVWLIRRQGPSRPSMLLLLVPPLAAIEAWLLFAERLAPVQMAGFLLALGGVLLSRSRAPVIEPA